MKQQVARLSPHQNAKVFGVITALNSLLILVPLMLLTSVFQPSGAPPTVFFIALPVILPIFYFVIGYAMVVIGCAVYNFMYRYIGGVEFETQNRDV